MVKRGKCCTKGGGGGGGGGGSGVSVVQRGGQRGMSCTGGGQRGKCCTKEGGGQVCLDGWGIVRVSECVEGDDCESGGWGGGNIYAGVWMGHCVCGWVDG